MAKSRCDIDLVKGGKGIRVVATTEKPTGSEIPSSSIIGSNYLSKDVLSSFETPTFDFIATGSTTYLTVDFSDASANDIDFKTILGQFKVSSLYEQGKPLGTKLLLSRRTGIFAGWNTKATGAGNFIDNSTIVNSDLTLYGRWTSHKCTVNYNPIGGTFTKHASDIKQVFDSGDSGISNMRDRQEDIMLHKRRIVYHILEKNGKMEILNIMNLKDIQLLSYAQILLLMMKRLLYLLIGENITN